MKGFINMTKSNKSDKEWVLNEWELWISNDYGMYCIAEDVAKSAMRRAFDNDRLLAYIIDALKEGVIPQPPDDDPTPPSIQHTVTQFDEDDWKRLAIYIISEFYGEAWENILNEDEDEDEDEDDEPEIIVTNAEEIRKTLAEWGLEEYSFLPAFIIEQLIHECWETADNDLLIFLFLLRTTLENLVMPY